MSFEEKHPYLFWQLIGWGILLIDFVFVVIAVFNDFGEWSYPIIVFTFIGALFAIIGSPFCLYATRATRVPQARALRRRTARSATKSRRSSQRARNRARRCWARLWWRRPWCWPA
ncbi:hypothetical protein LF916_00120 [Bifidobacterium pseudolongum]|uniref:hypothetical protein n=1 Tax=Bifidobacterium pseudolongum TaxID=1694 RepID=UPI001F10999E|nr:hypothetical protein [Bifidobacterium pseudolongum]MCH4859307.1 hypothetical protein [Bifidobacterium pseudolongum]MCH4861078.1 hypothetical protein [Bifidobacterium pseudolongum]